MWFKEFSIEEINGHNSNTMVEHLGIKITRLTEDSIAASMPVDNRTKQPFGILHGGANCVLAETLGSVGSNLIVDPEHFHAVGTSISTNHLKATRNGTVTGVATISHKGKTTHTWNIKTYNDGCELTSETIFSVMIISKLLK